MLSLFPFENIFYTFRSIESAYKYTSNGSIILIVSGEETDLVIGRKGDSDNYLIFPKTSSGWKIGTAIEVKTSHTQVYEGFSINLLQYRNTDEYYLMIFNSSGHPLSISDNRKSVFVVDKIEIVDDSLYCTYYAYINNFDNQYKLTVNNQDITLF